MWATLARRNSAGNSNVCTVHRRAIGATPTSRVEVERLKNFAVSAGMFSMSPFENENSVLRLKLPERDERAEADQGRNPQDPERRARARCGGESVLWRSLG